MSKNVKWVVSDKSKKNVFWPSDEMKKLAGWVLCGMIIISALVINVHVHIHKANKAKCLDSEYKTEDYDVSESNMLMCRNSNDDYVELKRREM